MSGSGLVVVSPAASTAAGAGTAAPATAGLCSATRSGQATGTGASGSAPPDDKRIR